MKDAYTSGDGRQMPHIAPSVAGVEKLLPGSFELGIIVMYACTCMSQKSLFPKVSP
jgi:hypothetical protein